jgi:hypothetical protein
MAFMLANLGFALLNDIIPERSQVYAEGLSVLLAAGMLVALVTCIAGWYPAWMIAKVQPIAIIRSNKPDNGRISSFSPRKALIISQFVIAQVFIVCALIMGTQLNYTLRKDLGFNKDAVVLFDVPWSMLSVKGNAEKHFALANELRRLPGITQLSLGREPMSDNYSSSQYDYWPEGSKDPIKRQVFRKEVDTNYVRFYELKLLAGRNLTHSDTTNEFVINETAMRAFGFHSPHDALGKIIGQPGNLFPVVGVVKDFHLTNFHNTIDPVALMSNKSNLSEFNVKLNTDDPAQWQHTIKQIESKWNDFFPAGTFNYKFYDETVEAMYKEERNTAKLINLATIISVVISCLGLFGLATLTAFQRTKEIGIRKVLGASVANIIKMLSADFVWLIIIALIIASPLAWWAMHRWLEGFAYRVEIEWWMFAIAGAAAVMVALITTSYQAIRAALENPVNSLRNE